MSSFDTFKAGMKARALTIRKTRIEVLKRKRAAEKRGGSPEQMLRTIQDEIEEILAILQKPKFDKPGSVRFNVTERDAKGRVKSFEVEPKDAL